jgi:hypothetical protein
VVDVGLPDHVWVIIIVENDEEQHRSYMTVCEVKRIAEIVESWAVGGNTLPIVLRYNNPHGFTVNGVSRRCHRRNA